MCEMPLSLCHLTMLFQVSKSVVDQCNKVTCCGQVLELVGFITNAESPVKTKENSSRNCERGIRCVLCCTVDSRPREGRIFPPVRSR